jgi:hypothetical protein
MTSRLGSKASTDASSVMLMAKPRALLILAGNDFHVPVLDAVGRQSHDEPDTRLAQQPLGHPAREHPILGSERHLVGLGPGHGSQDTFLDSHAATSYSSLSLSPRLLRTSGGCAADSPLVNEKAA